MFNLKYASPLPGENQISLQHRTAAFPSLRLFLRNIFLAILQYRGRQQRLPGCGLAVFSEPAKTQREGGRGRKTRIDSKYVAVNFQHAVSSPRTAPCLCVGQAGGSPGAWM